MVWKDMRHQGLQGASFGLMDGIIMIMGMLLGFGLSYPRRSMILLSIAMVGVSDGLANAAAFHVSEETEPYHQKREIHKAAALCFFATIFAFVLPSLPMLWLPIGNAIIVGELIAIILLIGVGIFVSEISHANMPRLVVEYAIMGILAAAACYGLGELAAALV